MSLTKRKNVNNYLWGARFNRKKANYCYNNNLPFGHKIFNEDGTRNYMAEKQEKIKKLCDLYK